jgi:hypothetical protein
MSIRKIGKKIKVAGVGTPRRDLGSCKHLGIDLDGKRSHLLVAQAANTQSCMKLPQGIRKALEILSGPANQTIHVQSWSGGSVGTGSYATDNEIFDAVAVKGLNEPE